MLSTLGNLFLIFALLLSCAQFLLPLYGYLRKNPYLLAFAQPIAISQFIVVACAYLLLTYAFISNDFSLAYVALNSHPSLPLMYRLTGAWGAHEGSILLWIIALNIWACVFIFFKRITSLESALTLAIMGFISCCFICFLFFTSNPFLLAVGNEAPQDLNPLLQDPGFVIHPPMLYMGYVGFSLSFAMTQAALICGTWRSAWITYTRQFALGAFSFLTLGIMLGSWWAYHVLGWGGFWFWDPVENASLLPWLSGIAFIHVLLLVEKRGIAKAWSILLITITFALSLLGTFLVRSGVLVSAHTFANDPARGIFLLGLLALTVSLSLCLFMLRTPYLKISKSSSLNGDHPAVEDNVINWRSREMSLLMNSALLTIAMLTVLLGTLYPLIVDALHLGAISVGAPYFNFILLPIVLLAMFLMGVNSLNLWQDQEKLWSWKLLIFKLVASFGSAACLLWFFTVPIISIPLLSLGLAVFMIMSIFYSNKKPWGMSVAHFGFAILIVGIVLSSLLNTERIVRMQTGDRVTVGPYQFYFANLEDVVGENYRGIRANFMVLKHNRYITILQPEKRLYAVREMVMTKIDIHPGIFRDLYMALGEVLDDNSWTVRIYYKPFIRFIWLGGSIMMLGGTIAMLGRRYRRVREILPEYTT